MTIILPIKYVNVNVNDLFKLEEYPNILCHWIEMIFTIGNLLIQIEYKFLNINDSKCKNNNPEFSGSFTK